MAINPYAGLNLGDLTAVTTVAECRSFVAAAITLGVSQPALTRTIQRVERLMDIALFERDTRHVTITAAGKEFVSVAERVLNDVRVSFNSLRERASEQRGRLVLSSVMSVSHTLLPRAIAAFRQTRPGVEITIREGVHGDVLEDLRTGAAELGTTYVDDLATMYRYSALGKEAFHVVLPVDHVLASRKSLRLRAIADEPMVALPPDSRTRRLVDAAALAQGLDLTPAVTVTQFATLMQCVAAGVGLSIVPGGAVAEALSAGLAARPLVKPAITRTLGIVSLKERDASAIAREFAMQMEMCWRATMRR